MLITLLLLVALQSHFAEFLKDLSSMTFVFSTYPLVSDWYSPMTFQFFPRDPGLSSHYSGLFRPSNLGADSLLLGFPVSESLNSSSLLILASSLSFIYELFCYRYITMFREKALPPPFSARFLSSNALLRVLLCWLVPSLLFRCLPWITSLHSQLFFMPLTLALGCFPLDLWPSRSKSVYNFPTHLFIGSHPVG